MPLEFINKNSSLARKVGFVLATFFLTQASFSQMVKPAATPEVHVMAVRLASVGAFACAERADQVGKFVSGGGSGKAETLYLQTPQSNPNNNLVLGNLFQDGKNPTTKQISTVVLAPNQANGCGGMYQTIFVAQEQCTEAIKVHFPDLKEGTVLPNTKTIATSFSRTGVVFASELEKGCLMIKQEMVE